MKTIKEILTPDFSKKEISENLKWVKSLTNEQLLKHSLRLAYNNMMNKPFTKADEITLMQISQEEILRGLA